jgi:hypothetical protein
MATREGEYSVKQTNIYHHYCYLNGNGSCGSIITLLLGRRSWGSAETYGIILRLVMVYGLQILNDVL